MATLSNVNKSSTTTPTNVKKVGVIGGTPISSLATKKLSDVGTYTFLDPYIVLTNKQKS